MTAVVLRCTYRRTGLAVAVLGGLALLHVGSAGGLPGVVSDVWEYRCKTEELARDQERTAELDEQIAIASLRTEFRQNLLDQLVDGQLPLSRAVEEYRSFTAGDAAFSQIVTAVAAGSDESERLANYLLTSLTASRTISPATRQRLASEFRIAFGHDPELRVAVGEPTTAAAPNHLPAP